jgi:hypothetical protein
MGALLHTGVRVLGRLETGNRVAAKLMITEHVRSAANIRHEPIGRYLSIRFSGFATRTTERAAWTHNILPLIPEIAIPGAGLTHDDLKLLARLWSDWDRNDLEMGCDEDGCPGKLHMVAMPSAEALVSIVSFFPRWHR